MKFLSDNAPTTSAALTDLETSAKSIESTLPILQQQLQHLGNASNAQQAALLDDLAGLYVELQLQLVDCYDALVKALTSVAENDPKSKEALSATQAKLSKLSEALLA